MAKQRKQKQKEHSLLGVIRSDDGVASSCSTILHQKLCVAIDLAAQQIYGHIELTKQGGKVGGVISLHARDLHIEQVLVDGVEANFEVVNPHNYHEANLHDGPDPTPSRIWRLLTMPVASILQIFMWNPNLNFLFFLPLPQHEQP